MFGIDLYDAALLPGMLVALSAGVLSFLSPCVLPIVPAYLAYMGGVTMEDMAEQRSARIKAVGSSLMFVLGLSTVFVILGFTASAFGRFFLEYQLLLGTIAGVVIYLFGLQFLGFRRAWLAYLIFAGAMALNAASLTGPNGVGLLPADGPTTFWGVYLDRMLWPGWPGLVILAMTLFCQFGPYDRFALFDRDARFDAGDRGGSAFGAYVLGLAFAFGWTPCIGPQLSAILGLAALEGQADRGALLLGVYAIGLGVPFLLSAAFLTQAQGLMARMKRHMPTIERAMGVLLVGVGVAIMTGFFTT
ncbi:MAG: cytochrome c biogenesis protein CcdA, partial [Pseudomonadota bacterium]